MKSIILAALMATSTLVSIPPEKSLQSETLLLGDYKVTHYCKYCNDGEGTATGEPLREGIVAGNPEVIPYGSIVIIDGREYVMADYCGASQSGNVIDIYVESEVCECAAKGVYYTELFLKN